MTLDTRTEVDARSGPQAKMGDMPPPHRPGRALIGRDAELRDLVDQLGIRAPTQPGRHHALVLAGEAGVGKTRLLTALRDEAFAAGWQVVAGHCLDLGDSALPYLPFSEIVGRIVADLPEVAARVGDSHPGLARLRPGRRLIAEDPGAEESAVSRAELFDGMRALLEEAAAVRPLLVVVEDTHWADRSTRDLISFLFTRPVPGPLAVVASYRSDDLHRRHPLRRTVAEWARVPGVGRFQLDPLGPGEVRALVHELATGSVDEADLAEIVDRAEGNAFFVEELVGAAVAGRVAVPDDLADLLLVRLDRLDDAAHQVVRAAAVAGRRVSHALLAAVVEIDEAGLEAALRSAVETNVLEPARGDGYAFRHALLAEAVYDDLLPGERARHHRAFVRAFTERTVPGTAAELARHARAAHDPLTALTASIQAGDEAMAVGGPDDATRHYEAALALLDDPGLPADLEVDRGALVGHAASALVTSGRSQRALALLQQQLAELDDDAPPVWRVQMLVALAATILLLETRLDPLEVSTEALAGVPRGTLLHARALNVHARALASAKRFEESREAAAEALALAEQLDLPKIATDAMTTLVGLRSVDLDADIVAALDEVVRRAAETGALATELRGTYLLARRHQDRGEFDEARRFFRRAAQRAAEAGAQWSPYGFDARFMDALVAYVIGDWDDVLATTDLAGQRAPALARAVMHSLRLLVHAGRGETDEAARLARDVHPHGPHDGLIVITAGAGMIDALGDRGDVAGAVAAHDETVEAVTRLWRSRSQVRVRLAALVVGQIARDVDHGSGAERDRWAEEVGRVVAGAQRSLEAVREEKAPWGPEGQAWEARLHAEELRFRWLAGIDPPEVADLVDAWERAVTHFEGFGHVFEVARSQARLAAVHRAAGDLEAARRHADPARTTAHALGATPLLTELRTLGTTPQPQAESTAAAALTPREREILALVADGRTNGEIGRQLFISTKTVSVHVSNILAKLDASSRTEAAAIARRRGLLG